MTRKVGSPMQHRWNSIVPLCRERGLVFLCVIGAGGQVLSLFLAPSSLLQVVVAVTGVVLLGLGLSGLLVQGHRARTRLQAAESALQMAELGRWWWDLRTGEVRWSDEVYRIFRKDPASFQPNIDSVLALSPWPEEQQRGKELMERASQSEEPAAFEQRFILPDGSVGYSRALFQGVRDRDGSLFALTGVVRDITLRKRAERELALVSSAIENSLNAFDIVNEEGKLIYVNRAYVDMWGYDSAEEIIGMSPEAHCADPETPARIIGALQQDGQCVIEFRARRKDGSVFDVLMYARLYHDDAGHALYPGTSIDITEKKRNERELQQYRDHLEELVAARTRELEAVQTALIEQERLATLGQLSASVSHEIRNPLGTIHASLYTLEKKLADLDLDVDAPLRRARRSIDRCVRIIDDLLLYGREHVVELVQVNFDDMIQAWVGERSTAMGAAGAGYSLDAKVDVLVDWDSFWLCLDVVWRNARDACVGTSVPDESEEGVRVTLSSSVREGWAEVRVADEGAGIAAEDLPRVFEPLYSTKGFGAGLGLAIAKDLMEAMGGEVVLESALGEGTVVTLRLPVSLGGGGEEAEVGEGY